MHRVEQRVLAFTERDQFSEFIWEALKTQYPPTKYEQNPFRQFLLGTGEESTVSGLNTLHYKLEKDAQKLLFRQAIGDVLRQHGNAEDTPYGVCRDLIYLIGKVRAVESVDALVPTVGYGLLGKKHPDLLYDIIPNLSVLSHAPEVEQTMSELIGSPNFDNRCIFVAVGLLVDCNPAQTPGILEKFAPHFADLRKKAQVLDGKEWEAYLDAAKNLTATITRYNPAVPLNFIQEKFFGNNPTTP